MKCSQIYEVNMSPTRLARTASTSDALVGIEYEMLHPELRSNDDPMSRDFDFSMNFEPTSISSIVDFFKEGANKGNGNVSMDDIAHLRYVLNDDFHVWLDERIADEWEEDKDEYILTFVKTQGFSDEDLQDEDHIADIVEKAIDDTGSDLHKAAYESYRAEKVSELKNEEMEREWLESVFYTVQEVAEYYEVGWPYVNESELTFEEVADSLSAVLGDDVVYGGGNDNHPRHQVGDNFYILETDSSVEDEDSDAAGIELVSYPMDLETAQIHFSNIQSWADSEQVYTNQTCGLHVNVSLPDRDMDQFDALKAAVFLGDQYVLAQFGREFNRYAQSSYEIIKDAIEFLPVDKVNYLLNKIRSDVAGFVDSFKSAVIRRDKYMSIHVRGTHVEFRSMGDDWLIYEPEEIFKYINRYVTVMDIATDPTKYKKEYLKHIHELLQPAIGSEKEDPISLFVNYSLGQLNKKQLKSRLQQRRENN